MEVLKESVQQHFATQHTGGAGAEAVIGGFTATEKFAVTIAGETEPGYFVKATFPGSQPDAFVLEVEQAQYQTLHNLGLCGEYVPKLIDTIDRPDGKGLVLEYIDASWGGPWTVDAIKHVHSAITALHSVTLTDAVIDEIETRGKHLGDYMKQQTERHLEEEDHPKLFEQAWDEAKTCLTNSRGMETKVDSDLYSELKNHLARWDKKTGQKLILRDLNFGNIGLCADRAVFVDPVYMGVGNPASDLVNLGLGMLRVLPETATKERNLVKELFLQDKPALAATTQALLAISVLKYEDEKDDWMDYHHEMLQVTLRFWHELLNER